MNYRARLPYRTLFRVGPFFLANTTCTFRLWVGRRTKSGTEIVWGRR